MISELLEITAFALVTSFLLLLFYVYLDLCVRL